jgi:hypothetical protein
VSNRIALEIYFAPPFLMYNIVLRLIGKVIKIEGVKSHNPGNTDEDYIKECA